MKKYYTELSFIVGIEIQPTYFQNWQSVAISQKLPKIFSFLYLLTASSDSVDILEPYLFSNGTVVVSES